MSSKARLLLVIAFFLAVNALAYAGTRFGYWPLLDTWYFYWAESALAGGLTLILYAKHLLVFFLLLAAIGYGFGFNNVLLAQGYKIPASFWAIYSLFWLSYFELRKSRMGQRIRLLHPIQQFFVYLFYMAASIAGAFALTSILFYGKLMVPELPEPFLVRFAFLTILIPTLTILMLKVVDMIGAKHFFDFLLGTYHGPVERKRIVMFMDMEGSAGMAEKLSPKAGMELIARFIFDAGTAFRMHGGDIVNYTGDGLLVLWPMDQADRALAAVDMLNARLESGRERYESQFGALPQFRIGIHAGSLVISQIGEEKLFLGVYGDVVNTAARIEQMNKKLGTRILFSKAFRQRVSLGQQSRIVPMGITEVSGREESVEIFTIQKNPPRRS